MSTPKWTPGPWTVQENRGHNDELAFHSIHAPSEDGFAPYISSTWGGPNEANARLIAAAPELYEALEEILRCSAISEHWTEPARATLAKAREE